MPNSRMRIKRGVRNSVNALGDGSAQFTRGHGSSCSVGSRSARPSAGARGARRDRATCPQGGGRRRHGDREVLAAIIFVPTSGCTWSRCAIDSVDMRAPKGGPDRSESCRPGQERCEDPLDHRTGRSAPVRGGLRGQHPRQPGPAAPGPRDTAHPFTTWAQAAQAREAPRRRGLRLRPPAPMAPCTRDRPPPCTQGCGVLEAVGPAPVAGRAHHGLAGRMPPPAPPLRAQADHFLAFAGIAGTLIRYRRLTK